METISTSVLVVGGGLVGLSSAVFLGSHGVPTVLVERYPGSSLHPRAIGFRERTIELYSSVGLGEKIPPAPPNVRLRRARVESLAGKWILEEEPWSPEEQELDAREQSPCKGAAIAQDSLEPLLRDKAIALGIDVRLQTELLSFEQDADGVTAHVRGPDGGEVTVRAAYLIAADGHRSPVREALGIGRSGRGHLKTARSVLFRAPLEEYLRDGVAQFNIEQPDLRAFLTTYGDGRWVLIFSDDEERDEMALRAAIQKAIGRTDLPIEIITTGRWEVSALIADTFASGRVFIAGDAAHTLPPNRGGFGANTGIEDAHNLAWKLAAVLSGTSGPELLATYDAERRPVAWLRHDQIFARSDFKAFANIERSGVPLIEEAAMQLGQLYRSRAVLGAGDELPPALRPDQWAGQPGTRAPHVWITLANERSSTLDLFGRGWVLLTEDERWSSAAARAERELGIELRCLRIDGLRAAFGWKESGASLIRPDGYIAWRSVDRPADPEQALTDALAHVSFAV